MSKKDEVWKKIKLKNLKGDYEISNYGLIRDSKNGKIKPRNIRSGYLNIIFSSKETNKIISKKIHRLVAETFIKNDDPENKIVVNHINGDKYDCRVSNLEWTTYADNAQHAVNNELTPKNIKGVIKYDIDTGEDIKKYDSILEASKKNNIDDGFICKVLSGERKKAGGYGWKYINEEPNKKQLIDLSEYKQIIGFPNYLINKEGDIYSLSYKRFMKFQDTQEGCKSVQLTSTEHKKSFLIHRLVASHFLKKKNKKYNSIHHIDGNKENNNIENLEWCYIPGVTSPEENGYNIPYYDPKTAIKIPKRKQLSSGPKNLLTANPRNLSKKQREERKILLEKNSKNKSSGSKSNRPNKKKK
nr:hypothetical protein [Megavirus caiporensis]